jgi:molybdopterin biosynthesis enzyme
LITTSDVEARHGALLIVQRNVVAPIDNPVTPEVALDGVTTVVDPGVTTDQVPVPIVGTLPANVVVEAHIF